MKRVCATCKWSVRTVDDFDVHSESGRGRRVLRDCGRRIPTNHDDKRSVPLMLTVTERESNPNMREEDSFIHMFGCNFWEAIEQEDDHD